MRSHLEKQDRYKGDDRVDLDDLSALEWRIAVDYGNVPREIELAIQNNSK